MKKHHAGALWTDRVGFEVSGPGAGAFLNRAAREGVALWKLNCTVHGYAGQASGADVPRLRRIARAAGTDMHLQSRRGPGRMMERLAARPGLLAGAGVFVILQGYCSGFLWNMDFGGMEEPRQAVFRQALSAEGIREGCRIDEDTLRRAEQTLQTAMQDVGWLSLNFTSGCLSIEETERQIQTVEEAAPQQALYAKAAGEVLAVELKSGFAEVAPGQYVAPGQLLANGQKADRDGDAVVQGAAGRILGRMKKTYAAAQPLRAEAGVLTGSAWIEESWQLLGHTWQKEPEQAFPQEDSTVEWIPFRLGRVALPGGICRITHWEKKTQTTVYSEEAARDLAARSCRQQLLQDFPDAELEEQALSFETEEGAVVCTAEYVFCADMAQPGALSPLPEDGTAG